MFEFFLLSLALLPQPSGVAPPVEIRASFENRVHHEMKVEIRFAGIDSDPLQVRMSRSSPGRYALHEFAKNVYGVEAKDSLGKPLEIKRPNAHQWDVGGHDGVVAFSYILFGDRCDGTYSQIDSSHAHLNIPATFAWARGLESRPVELHLELPEGWSVSSQLERTDAGLLRAPDLQYFLDSPIMASEHDVYSWSIGEGSLRQDVRVALHHQGSEDAAKKYVSWVEQIVDEQVAIFGEAPRFEGGTYTFLADYLPWCSGDGMEHRNSTVLSSSSNLDNNLQGLLGTVSHEFIHVWNTERIRASSLEPFDFERANMSGELWFGEGFTSYYDRLVLTRIGAMSLDDWAQRLSQRVEAITNTPARRFHGPVAVSRQAPFVDAASWVDPTNRLNTFLSYYTYGAAIGLALDLEIRHRFAGQSLDDYMAAAWNEFGRPERPFSNSDLLELLGRMTGDSTWSQQFFERYVYGSDLPDYARLLEPAGFVVRQRSREPWLGAVRLEPKGDGLRLTSGTRVGSPFYEAGLDRGDVLMELNGRRTKSLRALNSVLDRAAVGENLSLVANRRGERLETTIEVGENPAVEVIAIERTGQPLSAAQVAFRESWLGRKSTARDSVRAR